MTVFEPIPSPVTDTLSSRIDTNMERMRDLDRQIARFQERQRIFSQVAPLLRRAQLTTSMAQQIMEIITDQRVVP